ncbi:GmrSD restriction endonuclease domain-containing protein [Candidatus Rariloculus sp.]|uniref:GmrSD restriction endonuclease domain-containing protein n=1 Tax=Candidatus Rariloculus sp. TaxID=3101265 RepID=UPI003D0CAF18
MKSSGTWIALIAALGIQAKALGQETYRGVRIAAEVRCTPYDRDDYAYPQSVESQIIAGIGKIYGPYTGQCFATARETDIEHIVSLSEAHDSGLCSASAATKTRFARDVLNLTLASPRVNRYEKGAKDAAEWQPQRNACWFANRTLEVRRKYGLSIDRREAIAIENTLAGCASTEMVVLECGLPAETRNTAQPPRRGNPIDALERWDDNRNGQITCAEARRGRGRNEGATRPRSVPAIATIATR